MDPLFPEIPENFADLDDEALAQFVTAAEEVKAAVTANAAEYVGEGRTKDELVTEFGEGLAALKAAKAEQASRAEAEPEGDEPEGDGDETDAELAATVAQLAAEGDEAEAEGDDAAEEGDEAEAETEAPAEEAAAESVIASAKPRRLPKPARSRAATPQPSRDLVSMTAAIGGLGPDIGQPVDELEVARMTIKKRSQFGRIPQGTKGEKISIAQFDFKEEYPEDRHFSNSPADQSLIDSVTDQSAIRRAFENRREGALVASGGLCAPVTPYYNLQMVSVPDRPVRAALPAFLADRGGINAALPLSLSSITTGVGDISAAHDKAGGSSATKTCQVIACPSFVETDVEIIYHCIQFGNLGARTFPERVAQANSLVLAAHARVAESMLLSAISAASTKVTAASITGATGDLLGQILTAANGMRSRHRMDPEAVLRIMLPDWSLDLLISDIIRSQFQRFDMTEEGVVALLRSFDLEPSFYIDGPAGGQQVFGAQVAGPLLSFPANVVWYLFPEGSFLYLDGGTLELGIVRDSVLNSTNDFQIFGESFENVAFVGVESLVVTSATCDSGAVSLPVVVSECGDYGPS